MANAFITNMCTHYRMPIFTMLAERLGVDFFFFSRGEEKYWNYRLGIVEEGKNFHYLKRGRFSLTTLSLIWKLFSGRYDVVVKCTNGKLALPLTFLTAKVLGKKFILWQPLWYHPQTLFHRLSFPFLKFIQNHSDAILVYGTHGKEYLVKLGVPPEKIFIAWQTVDNSLYNMPVSEEEKSRLKKELDCRGKRIILFVGRLEEVKGLGFLIEAIKRLSLEDTVLLLVGDGSEKEKILAEGRRLNLSDKIRHVPFVPNQDLYRYYAIADIFVLPSITTPNVKEAWGLVINEAMNQGCPIVATNAVGAAVGGLIQDGQNGLVVPEQNVDELAQALHRILTDEVLYRRMSENSQKTIMEWTYERMFRGFEDAIRFCLARNKS